VSQLLADQLGGDCVLGGLSNLGATMSAPGVYEQRNAGHLLIGELARGESERADRVRGWLGRAVEVRVTPNFRGAIWSKLQLNCSVTTIGAIAARTMREYIALPEGRELFDRTYDEALSVEGWLGQILAGYGDLKASMLQDFERGRTTEVDFINGYVVDVGRQFGVPPPVNAAIVQTVHAITRKQIAPAPALLGSILKASRR
jgi:2-dehydropantoate 2-reductase